MLILDREQTAALLEPDALREAVARAMAELSSGGASQPPRIAAVTPDGGLLAAMPAYVGGIDVLAAKLVSLFPGNAGSSLPTHQAVVLVFDARTGQPMALLDGTTITEARTAAGSALSTDLLARPDAAVLAILGTGAQARAHAEAVVRVRPFRQLRIYGRRPEAAEELARGARWRARRRGRRRGRSRGGLRGRRRRLRGDPRRGAGRAPRAPGARDARHVGRVQHGGPRGRLRDGRRRARGGGVPDRDAGPAAGRRARPADPHRGGRDRPGPRARRARRAGGRDAPRADVAGAAHALQVRRRRRAGRGGGGPGAGRSATPWRRRPRSTSRPRTSSRSRTPPRTSGTTPRGPRPRRPAAPSRAPGARGPGRGRSAAARPPAAARAAGTSRCRPPPAGAAAAGASRSRCPCRR